MTCKSLYSITRLLECHPPSELPQVEPESDPGHYSGFTSQVSHGIREETSCLSLQIQPTHLSCLGSLVVKHSPGQSVVGSNPT